MPGWTSNAKRIVLEAALVIAAGLAVAFAANALSPSGLKLTRNYFPGGTNSSRSLAAPPLVKSTPDTGSANELSEADQIAFRLRDKGLQGLSRSQVEQLFHDPGYRDGRIVFVDARDEDHYQDGHIPGAYPLNPYHPEKQLPGVLTVCQAADKVVVYCTGGDCEDADSTALLLRDGQVPTQRLFVYGGGFNDWEDNHLPVETGTRHSGSK